MNVIATTTGDRHGHGGSVIERGTRSRHSFAFFFRATGIVEAAARHLGRIAFNASSFARAATRALSSERVAAVPTSPERVDTNASSTTRVKV